MTIEEIVKQFVEETNTEYPALKLAIEDDGPEGQISVHVGHFNSHIYIDEKTGEVKTELADDTPIVQKFIKALTPKPKATGGLTMAQATKNITTNMRAQGEYRRGSPTVPATIRDVQVAELTLEDIRGYICKDATDQEAFMFLKLCQARNLNPFTNEAYLVKYGSKATMIVGKEAFMRKAELHPQYKGFKAGVIVDDGEGSLIYREGAFVRKGEELLGGWAEVFRKDRDHPVRAEVALKDYERNDSPSWKNHKATMIRKVPLVQAMREAFPSDLAGCYDSSEFRDAMMVPE